jgi:outer membrane phospholipase A
VTYDLLTFYQGNYVLTGVTNAVEVKLQFRAKYDMWPNDSHHAVYFAFTGKAIWNAYQSSAPFVESNYAPEVFYTYFHHKDRSASPRGCGFFHERVGALHESNGEAGPGSRSWNRLYLGVTLRVLRRRRPLRDGLSAGVVALRALGQP